MRNEKVIVAQQHKLMLVPLNMCMGADMTAFKRKAVTYKMQDYMMMPWTQQTCRAMAKVGVEILNPAVLEYDWSGLFRPRRHQLETFSFLINNPRSFVFNDIGTGKTLSALWAADYLIKTGQISKVLVASTLSTLERVWYSEIFKHFTGSKMTVVHGEASKRKRLLAEDHTYYIINHDGVKTMQDQLRAKDFDLIILDEGATFRNHKTALWKAMHYLANEDTGAMLWWMTGSPMPKAPTDVWAQARIVNPGTVPKYWSRFREATMYQINQFKWVPRNGWEDIVYSSLKPSIRFHRDDCLDLPPCTYVDHEVKMTPAQQKAYDQMVKDFMMESQEGLITAVNEGAKRTKLVQIACGAVYNNSDGSVSELDCKTKFKELEDIIIEAGNKLIVFIPFKNLVPMIQNWLDKLQSKPTFGVVNGDVNKTKRDKIFHEFQHGELNIILAHPKAMAHGLTLTASHTIAWWGPVDDYEIYEQANGRITRDGQEHKQYVKRLIASPIEKAIYKRLENKESMQGLVLDMFKK